MASVSSNSRSISKASSAASALCASGPTACSISPPQTVMDAVTLDPATIKLFVSTRKCFRNSTCQSPRERVFLQYPQHVNSRKEAKMRTRTLMIFLALSLASPVAAQEQHTPNSADEERIDDPNLKPGDKGYKHCLHP